MPFTFPGVDALGRATTETAYEGHAVLAEPHANVGRINPFGSSNMGPTSVLGMPTGFNDGGTLRFAGSRNTTPTTSLAWGITSSQLPPRLGGTNYVSGLDIVAFRYAVHLGSDPVLRDLVAGVPVHYVNLGRATWYYDVPTGDPINAPIGTVDTASIHVVPSPPIGTVLGCWALVAMRRRGGGA